MTRIAAVCCALVIGTAPAADPPVVKPPPPPDGKPAKEKPKLPTTKEEFAALAKAGPHPPWYPSTGKSPVDREHIKATVVDVSDEWIEVQVEGKKGVVRYPAHELLASGAVCHWQSDSSCYLLADVKKGDEVVLAVGTVDKNKGEECFFLSIRWRAGGKIPPSRKPSEPNPYHERRQREVEYEDKGEYTPEELQSHEDKKRFCAEKGLPPPPDLPPRKPRAKPADEPKKDEAKKKD